MKTCKYCGSQISDDAKACSFCGRPVDDAADGSDQQAGTVQAGAGQGEPSVNAGTQQSWTNENQNQTGSSQQPFNAQQQNWNNQQPFNNVQQPFNAQQQNWNNQQPDFNAQQSNWNNQQNWNNSGSQPGASHVNGLAIASMVCGILAFLFDGFFFIPSIIAIIFGIVALSQMKKNPDYYSGKGFAVAGLVLGIVSLVIYIILIVITLVFLSSDSMQGVYQDLYREIYKDINDSTGMIHMLMMK